MKSGLCTCFFSFFPLSWIDFVPIIRFIPIVQTCLGHCSLLYSMPPFFHAFCSFCSIEPLNILIFSLEVFNIFFLPTDHRFYHPPLPCTLPPSGDFVVVSVGLVGVAVGSWQLVRVLIAVLQPMSDVDIGVSVVSVRLVVAARVSPLLRPFRSRRPLLCYSPRPEFALFVGDLAVRRDGDNGPFFCFFRWHFREGLAGAGRVLVLFRLAFRHQPFVNVATVTLVEFAAFAASFGRLPGFHWFLRGPKF